MKAERARGEGVLKGGDEGERKRVGERGKAEEGEVKIVKEREISGERKKIERERDRKKRGRRWRAE